MALDKRIIFAKRTMIKYSTVTELETRDHKGNYSFRKSQESLCVASGAQIPASCMLACYWSMVVCYWGISQSQTTTQLAGIWAPLHGDQQHTGTFVEEECAAEAGNYEEI